MRYRYLLVLIATVVLFSCKKEKSAVINPSQPPVNPPVTVFLKDIVLSNLPSPYYHFEYSQDGKVIFVSFASELTRYNVVYEGNAIAELRNNILVNKDRIIYSYDEDGKVNIVMYADSTGFVFEDVQFRYEGSKLVRLERQVRRINTGFFTDKVMTMTYYADGNLKELTDHRFPVFGQLDQTFTDRFEQYDDKINVDAFSLLHNDFFDHLFLLPGVQLQKNNPRRIVRTGDITFNLDYTYTYNQSGAPLTRSGDFVYTSGPQAGQHFLLSCIYSYY
jgi:hypothetical protein